MFTNFGARLNWKDAITKVTDVLIDIIKVFTEEGGAVALAIIDVGVSGFVLTTVLGQDAVFGGAGKIIAFAISLALSSLAIRLWRSVDEGTLKGDGKRKWTTGAVVQIIVVVLLQVGDLFIDMGVMELIQGSGDLMRFSFSSMANKPTMWWIIALTIAILTGSNEWLINSLRRKSQKKQQTYAKRPAKKRPAQQPRGGKGRDFYEGLTQAELAKLQKQGKL